MSVCVRVCVWFAWSYFYPLKFLSFKKSIWLVYRHGPLTPPLCPQWPFIYIYIYMCVCVCVCVICVILFLSSKLFIIYKKYIKYIALVPSPDSPLCPQGPSEVGGLRAGAPLLLHQRAALHQQGDHPLVPAPRAAAGRGALRAPHRRLELRLHPGGALPEATALPGNKSPYNQ